MNAYIAKGSHFIEIAKQPDSPRKIKAGLSEHRLQQRFAVAAQRSMLAAEPGNANAVAAASNAEWLVEFLKTVFNDPRVILAGKAAGITFAAMVVASCGSIKFDEDVGTGDDSQADVAQDVEPDVSPDAEIGPEVPDVMPDVDVPEEADSPPVDVPDVITDYGEADALPEAEAEADAHEDAPAEAEAETPEDVPEEAEGADAPDVLPEAEAETDSTETTDTYDCTGMSRAETVVVVEAELICGARPTTTDLFTVAWNEGADCVDTTETWTWDSREIDFASPIADVACARGDLLHAPNGFEVIIETGTAMLNSAKEIVGTRGPPATPLVYGGSLGGAPNWRITAGTFYFDHFNGAIYDGTGASRGFAQVYGTAALSRAALGLPYTGFPMAPPATEGVMAYDYTGGGFGNTGASIIRLPMMERTIGSMEGLLGTDGTTVVGTCAFGTVLSGGSLAGYIWLCTPAKK